MIGIFKESPFVPSGRTNSQSLVANRKAWLRSPQAADKSLELNWLFVESQKFFGEAQKLGKEILKQLAV